MRTTRVLLTGGDGFVGRYLAKALNEEEIVDEVIVGTLGDARSHGGIQAVTLDVTNAAQVRDVISSVRPSHVFHLAAIAGVATAERNQREVYAVNFGGTLNVALAVSTTDPTCGLLYCSSGEVYGGNHEGSPLQETSPLNPSTVYGASKAAADLMIGQMVRDGLRAVRLRPFNHTGVGQSEEYVVPNFAAQIARIEQGMQHPVMLVGNIETKRDFLDVRDVVAAYVRCVLDFDKLALGSIINIASGRALAVREILAGLLSLSEVEIAVRSDATRFRSQDPMVKIGDPTTAKALLGWKAQISFDGTLRCVLESWRNQMKGQKPS